ncbi:MAG: glutaminyl-peptide cyclotransferase [Ferruginibacter sp.]
MKKCLIAFSLLFLIACNNNNNTEDNSSNTTTTNAGAAAPQTLNVNVIGVYPHDTGSFTEGLEIYKGKLYESAGDYENSKLSIADITTGKIEQKHGMGSPDIFGEGITIFKDKIYQLTWVSHIVYVYDINNIDKPIKTFTWPHEGWGQTHDSTELIVSDGSAYLYLVNPDDYSIKSTIEVTDNYGPVTDVNELEYVDGYIYANVWQTNYILKIDPSTGHVVGKALVPDLLKQFAPDQVSDRTDVLNGIAYDHATQKMYITGKRWPKLFEVTFN